MLFNLIKIERGKETIVMTDQRTKVNNRLKTLRTTYKGKKITFRVDPADTNEKFQQKPHDRVWS